MRNKLVALFFILSLISVKSAFAKDTTIKCEGSKSVCVYVIIDDKLFQVAGKRSVIHR
jgi:hypothetical protein